MPEAGNPASFIGQALKRREDDWLLNGRGKFINDLPEPPDMLHMALVLSPEAHARIVSIDTEAAAEVSGVFAVLSGADLEDLISPIKPNIEYNGYRTTERDCVARQKVRFVGDIVAVVLAKNRYVAEDAVELVYVEYETLPSISSIEMATAPDAPLVHEELGENLLFETAFQTDGFEDILHDSPMILRETFRKGRVAGVPIEPRGCVANPVQGGHSLELWTSTQIPHLVRTALSRVIDFPEANIKVITPEVGGGFGTKAHFYPEEAISAALALKYGRPVKWFQDRREELLTNAHARDHLIHMEVGCDTEGVLQAVRVNITSNGGAYSVYPYGVTLEVTAAARMLLGPYRIRNYAYVARSVATHTCPTGAYRGTGQPSAFLAIEGMLDRIGRKIGVDPAEVRRRNLISTGELPYVNAVGVKYETGSYLESMEKALEAIGYKDTRARQGADRLLDGKLVGLGICSFTEVSGTNAAGFRVRGWCDLPGFDSVNLRVEPTGTIIASVSHATSGQGLLTTFAQVTAEALGANIDDVIVVEGDTSRSPYGTNTFASRSAITGGGAIIRASEKLTPKMRRIAALLLQVSPSEIVLENSVAKVAAEPERQLSFKEIATAAYSLGNDEIPKGETFGLEAVDFYEPPLVTMANATVVARVSVDPELWSIEVDKIVVVHDCGRVINPMIVQGQIHGGIAQGLGEALFEYVQHDEHGQMLSANLLDYQLPTSRDLPDIEIHHIESPSTDTVGGFKGVGECGQIGAVPALTNAVADALSGLNVNVNRIPLRPSMLMELMENSRR